MFHPPIPRSVGGPSRALTPEKQRNQTGVPARYRSGQQHGQLPGAGQANPQDGTYFVSQWCDSEASARAASGQAAIAAGQPSAARRNSIPSSPSSPSSPGPSERSASVAA